jgi:hypothetical protein
MSETIVADPADAGGAAPEEAQTRARVMGWKPKEQFRGDPEKWVPAEEFLDRGIASPAIMAERLAFMGDRLARQERDNQHLAGRFDEAIGTINTMTTMLRTSEKRQFERAKAELEQQREKAVEVGDTATFRRLDTEVRELEKTAPVTMAPPVAAPNGGGRAAGADNPAVQAFYQRNPWYSKDPMLTQEADIIHTGLVNARPDMTVEQNLAEVERRLRTYFPDRFRGAAAPSNGAAASAFAENPRREEPGAVSPAAAQAPLRRQTTRRGFQNMPQESKTAYVKYKKMLEGHGEPLSEHEWAEDYWSQFPDDGTA